MSETLYFGMIGLVIVVLLMIFKPFRQLILGIFGAKTIYGLIWSFVATVSIAHWVVLRNFMPRNFVLPTLDDRKTTNAED